VLYALGRHYTAVHPGPALSSGLAAVLAAVRWTSLNRSPGHPTGALGRLPWRPIAEIPPDLTSFHRHSRLLVHRNRAVRPGFPHRRRPSGGPSCLGRSLEPEVMAMRAKNVLGWCGEQDAARYLESCGSDPPPPAFQAGHIAVADRCGQPLAAAVAVTVAVSPRCWSPSNGSQARPTALRAPGLSLGIGRCLARRQHCWQQSRLGADLRSPVPAGLRRADLSGEGPAVPGSPELLRVEVGRSTRVLDLARSSASVR
jgi:hypothetical protein